VGSGVLTGYMGNNSSGTRVTAEGHGVRGRCALESDRTFAPKSGIRRPVAARYDQTLPRVRRVPQDWAQALESLSGTRGGGARGPVASTQMDLESIGAETAEAILAMRRKHPTWGPLKLKALLERESSERNFHPPTVSATCCASTTYRSVEAIGTAMSHGRLGCSRCKLPTKSGARTTTANFVWATARLVARVHNGTMNDSSVPAAYA
jgi:hypothetical protein